MAHVTYADIPSLTLWMRDSSVAFATRKQDIILTRVDRLLEDYHRAELDPGRQSLILCDLFLTIDCWVKSLHARNANCEKGRYNAMMNLFGAVVKQLKLAFVVHSDVELSNALKEFLGLGMSAGGHVTDQSSPLKPFSDDERARARLWFKDGLAYQVPWWENSRSLKKQLASSYHGYIEMKRGEMGGQSPSYCGFVMTLDREIYMRKQDRDAHQFHSSYNGGARVIMAGTMLVRSGRILGIRTDSGHYKPGVHNLNTFLWALLMFGVELSPISILDHKGDYVTSADKFLADNNKWSRYLDGRENEIKKLGEAQGQAGFQNRAQFGKRDDLQAPANDGKKSLIDNPYEEASAS
ncbi:hypothetical protein Msil_1802 [Methylocella silvestris BL2]|uniref:Uncharacterized protein n=1 Tax=Methylocella silvestris (strain DSM 15510 / CIP 108128 / LMG 27833 / NCIMB 13906 / BL2) TaxID=395965 RepID=B8ELW6_METSB|nr:hypothetical protein [Methylocella silvestris]ACK50747.1 hypothetical protein Msil_1802 [Methylocella silvestris BL2]